MRLFVALEVPGSAILEELHYGLKSLGRGMKPTRPDRQHITLKFIGDPGCHADRVADALSEYQPVTGPFRMRASHGGTFPSWSRPSVLWIGLDNSERCSVMAEGIDRKLNESIGTRLEKRKFKPHLTVARVKGRIDKKKTREMLGEAVERLRAEDYSVPVDQYHLISSTLTPQGPIYERVRSFPLTE